jgi:hypothetical protein
LELNWNRPEKAAPTICEPSALSWKSGPSGPRKRSNGAGSESHTAGGDPDENCFNIDANMDLGKNSSRFWGQKGNSDL